MSLNSWLCTLVMALTLLSARAHAQVGELHDAVVIEKTSITKPAKAIKAAEGQWIAFRLPVLAGTRSPCCWKGQWKGRVNDMGESGCSLNGRHQSYGTQSESPLTENVIVYSKIQQGEVNSLHVVGEFCPVAGDGAEVTWLGDVDEDAGLDWLESVASSNDSALYALGLHRADDANRRLITMAKNPNGELSGEAIFWLGVARGKAGFDALKQLLDELSPGATRRHINFALAQNDTPGAVDLLLEISESDRDPEQRSDALFWLAQEYPDRAEGILLEIVNSEQDEDVLEQAVFAISELPGDSGSKILMDLARNDQTPQAVRRQALFWLANSDDEKTIAALTELLTR